jgi:hypothetical protein
MLAQQRRPAADLRVSEKWKGVRGGRPDQCRMASCSRHELHLRMIDDRECRARALKIAHQIATAVRQVTGVSSKF